MRTYNTKQKLPRLTREFLFSLCLVLRSLGEAGELAPVLPLRARDYDARSFVTVRVREYHRIGRREE